MFCGINNYSTCSNAARKTRMIGPPYGERTVTIC